MTEQQLAEYAALKTVAERAKYLLQFDITTFINIKDNHLVKQAFIGQVALPVTGGSDDEVIKKARDWLELKAEDK